MFLVHYGHMRKETALGAIAGALILGGVIFYAATRPATSQAPASPLGGTSYVEHSQYYDIAANYASSTPLAGSANTTAVVQMKQFVSDTIAQFKTDGNFASLTAADITTLGLDRGRKETLEIKYLMASSPRTASYIFTVYEDTLGAHGNTFFHTFTFDKATGASLALGDLFTPGSGYLATLSALSRAKLPKIIGDNGNAQMLESGTTPDAKNFSDFFFDNHNLVVLFDPYKVAPYSSGPQTLYIPTSELGSLLKTEYR